MSSISPDYERRRITPARMAAVLKYSADSILDVGCGNGAYVLFLKDKKSIKGVDYKYSNSWDGNRELFDIADAQALNYPDDSVDTIISFETLEHLDSPMSALREFHRVAKKNIIISVPSCELTTGMKKSGLIYNHWIDRTHQNFWEMRHISKLIEQAGFKIVDSQYINNINLGYLFMESIGLKGALLEWMGKVFYKLLQRKKYPMTCLIVAEKIS
jgi:SAM-dependent methyltransferase